LGATLVLEMGCSADEFAYTLPRAMRDWPVSGGPDLWQVADPQGAPIATIRVAAQSERRIGALSLPVLRVTIDLDGLGETKKAEFVRRFECGFHRGGG
jgi:hypothetical protein